MIRSMTGFGRSQYSGAGLHFAVEMSTVNRRTLEFTVSLPREWQSMEGAIQEALKSVFERGRIHVSVLGSQEGASAGFQWDEEGVLSGLHRLRSSAEKAGVPWAPDADLLLRLAAMNKREGGLPVSEEVREHLLEAVRMAAEEVRAMREAEGRALGEDLHGRLLSLSGLVEAIRAASTTTVPRYRELLLQRLAQAGLEVNLEDERVLKEVALFADKCDISEELTRLQSHFSQFRECLESGSPIGRKLEFIVQELNREINTIGSKANQYGVSRQVIESKNEIERIREQIQNIE